MSILTMRKSGVYHLLHIFRVYIRVRIKSSVSDCPSMSPCLLKVRGSLINPLNAELNPIRHLLALLGGSTIVVVSRLRVKGNFFVENYR